jgi:hypothetical protein
VGQVEVHGLRRLLGTLRQLFCYLVAEHALTGARSLDVMRGDLSREFLNRMVEHFPRRRAVDQSITFEVAASTKSRADSISMACVRSTFRDSATPGVDQKTPMEIPDTANLTSSAAMASSPSSIVGQRIVLIGRIQG